VHNACKFTDTGYVHVTIQDKSPDVALPLSTEYESDSSSGVTFTVVIDIRDSGKGSEFFAGQHRGIFTGLKQRPTVSNDFLNYEMFRPFAKADPFMPGSGLGLALAQRMIEVLGGQMAIASLPGQGTLVHVEVPLHLLIEDNGQYSEDLDTIKGDESATQLNGIHLFGFETQDVGTRRLGHSLLRQLRYHRCTVVDDIAHASVIIIPDETIVQQVERLVQQGRPNVQVILLDPPHSLSSADRHRPSISKAFEALGVPVTRLQRPLRPSVLKRVIRAVCGPSRRSSKGHNVSNVVSGKDVKLEQEASSGPGTAGAIPISVMSSIDIGSIGDGMTSRPHESDVELVDKLAEKDEIDELAGIQIGPDVDFNLHLRGETHSEHGRSMMTVPVDPFLAVQSILVPSHIPPPVVVYDRNSTDSKTVLTSVSRRPSVGQTQTETATENVSPGPAGPSGPPRTNAEPLRVLVVEDNAVNRLILTTLLRRTACQHAEAVDGLDAVHKYQSFTPDLILLDINMPIKDGYTAASEIRALEANECREREKQGLKPKRRCWIVAVSAMGQESQKRKGLLECGIDEWKTKPVGLGVLRDLLLRYKSEVQGDDGA
jgi:CheY-like chemotaxis protein